MLIRLAGWLVVALLVGAPWALGCVDDWAKFSVGAVGVVSALAWTMHHIRTGMWPRVPRVCAAMVAGLLGLGWWMALNAHQMYVAPRFAPVEAVWPGGPGAVDGFTACETMVPLTGILGVLLVVCDLSQGVAWRRRFWWAMVGTGASVAIYGILGKMGVSRGIATHPYHPESVFGPFDYHGNAGAFLNMTLALAFALAVRGVKERWRGGWQVLSCAMLMSCVVAIFVNISRGAVVVAGGELLVLLLWGARQLSGGSVRRMWGIAAVGCLLVAGAAGAYLAGNARASGLLTYVRAGAHSGRVLAWRVAWGISTDAPVFGFGPGSFKLLFPRSPHWIFELYSRWVVTDHVSGRRVSEWSYACQDYLQTLVEWGWVGFGMWGALAIGGVWGLVARRRGTQDADSAWPTGVLVALAGVYVHALGDYPLQIVSLQVYVAAMIGMGWGRWRTPPSFPVV